MLPSILARQYQEGLIDYIDTSKAYTIVIPLMPELSEEAPAWSLRIPLK